MIENFKDYEKLFDEINSLAKIKINIYVIGGAVLLYRKIKASTKDIDIVVNTKKEFDGLCKIFSMLEFKDSNFGLGYDHFKLRKQFKKDDIQIDLFYKQVCSKFYFSENMVQRSEKISENDKVNIFLSSNEDIFAFKTMTERDGDLEDCISLATTGIDWNLILNEVRHQMKISGQDVWITWLNERLVDLDEKGIVVPILNETEKLTYEFIDKSNK